ERPLRKVAVLACSGEIVEHRQERLNERRLRGFRDESAVAVNALAVVDVFRLQTLQVLEVLSGLRLRLREGVVRCLLIGGLVARVKRLGACGLVDDLLGLAQGVVCAVVVGGAESGRVVHDVLPCMRRGGQVIPARRASRYLVSSSSSTISASTTSSSWPASLASPPEIG